MDEKKIRLLDLAIETSCVERTLERRKKNE